MITFSEALKLKNCPKTNYKLCEKLEKLVKNEGNIHSKAMLKELINKLNFVLPFYNMEALFNAQPGGTKQTIDYAKSQCLEIIVVSPVKEVLSGEELHEIIKENK